MSRYFIETVRCDSDSFVGLCTAVVEIKVRPDEGESFYMSLVEADGIPHFFRTPESVFDIHMKTDASDEEIDYIKNHFIETNEYEGVFEKKDPEWFELYRHLIWIMRECPKEKEADFAGKYLDEMEIPATDVEIKYRKG